MAVLWVTASDFINLLPKIAFHRSGHTYTHLSTIGHPFSPTRFATCFLNRIATVIERRFLVDRVVVSPTDSGAALRVLEACVGDNGVVALTAHRYAKRPLIVPFLNGQITLGLGAPILALKTMAPLLPVFRFRNAADVPTIVVGSPLVVDRTLTRAQAAED